MEAFWDQFPNLKHFNLEEIKSITGNFSANNFLGEGGFGKVYEGELSDSEGKMIKVAFKRSKSSQGNAGFMKEIVMLSSYKHDNLISLLGVCDKGGEKILAYEHASNGSLDAHLGSSTLTWTLRLNICLGAARGLAYLHDPNGAQQRVIHQDIKSSNILLDENWNAKISDMGLSKTGSTNKLLHSFLVATNISGTPSYIDPVYLKTGILTKESDVYSFGVVLFEVMCGSLCVVIKNNQNQFLMPWWKKSYKEKKLDEIIFHDLKQDMDMRSLTIFSEIAYQCLLKSRAERPQMCHVVDKLEILLKIEVEKQEKLEEEKQKKIEAEKQEKMRIEAETQKKIKAEEQEKMRIEMEEQKKIEAEELEIALNIQEEIFEIAVKGQDMSKQEEFKKTVKSVVNKKEVEMMLSTGIIINGGNTWFSLNENGEHCEMISAECFGTTDLQNPPTPNYVPYHGENKSRFEVRNRSGLHSFFNVHVKTQFLSPNITYKVNLVFMVLCGRTEYSNILYRSAGETEYLHSKQIYEREDGWLMAELYRVINGTSNVDLEFGFSSYYDRDGAIEVEGIEFVPLEKVHLEDGDEDLQTDTYCEQRLPNNYEDIIKWSKDRLECTTKRELYYIFCKGFPINSGEEWFSITKNGKIRHMLSAKQATQTAYRRWKWQSLPESRFPEVAYDGERLVVLYLRSNILSAQTIYGTYLVYKLQEPHDWFEHPVSWSQLSHPHSLYGANIESIYLLSSDEAQVIPGKFYQKKYLPQQRSDGWMEVQIYEFQTEAQRISIDLELCTFDFKSGVIVQGIEFKPIL